MSLIEFDVWLPPVDLSAAPDARLSTDDSLTDAGFNPVLLGEGDGFLEIHANDSDAQYLQRRGFVRAVRTDTEEPIFDFWLEEADTKILAKDAADKLIRWSGRGALYVLDRYRLGQAVYAPDQPNRGSVSITDNWTWLSISPGGILTRVYEEGFHHPSSFFSMVTVDFNRVTDSNDETWIDLTDYQTRIGTSVLQVAADMMRMGLIVRTIPVADSIRLQAFRDIDGFRVDRTSATFAAGKIRFVGGVNVAVELPQKIAALRERTHTLTRRQDGQYATETLNGSGEPYMDFMEVPWTSDPDAVEAAVGASHLARQKQSLIAVVQHRLGAVESGGVDGPGGYFPSIEGAYWLGDLVTVHAGDGEYELNEQTLEVAGIRYFLRGADWMIQCQLGAQVLTSTGAPVVSIGGGGPTVPGHPPLQICRDPIDGGEGEGPATRLYHTDNDDGTGLAESDRSGDWDTSTAGNYKSLATTPPNVTGSGPVWTDADGQPAETRFLRGFVSPALGSGSDLLSAIQNGANFRSQLRCRSRAGVGIDEGEQEDYGAMAVRLYRPGTGFVATLFALDRVTTQFRANSTQQNRSWDCTLAAFPTAAANDRVVIDYGSDHVAPTDDACGAALTFKGTTSDLPRDQTTTTDRISWVEIAEITTAPDYPGSLPEPTVLPGEETHGDCTGVSSCCHAHAHGEHGTDGALHDADQISGLTSGTTIPNLFVGSLQALVAYGTASSSALSANRAYYAKFIPTDTVTVDTARWSCTTSAGNLEFGIYDASFNLLATTGTFASPGTGSRSQAFSGGDSVVMTAGTIYYLAVTVTSTTLRIPTSTPAVSVDTAPWNLIGFENSANPLPATGTPNFSGGPVFPIFFFD